MDKINREKKRILCVEDHESACELLGVILADHSLFFASNFADGLLLARRRYFDLYLLDNWLPGKSGIELCWRIREFDPHTPILFCSGAAYERDRQEALSAGAQAYLVKPVDPRELEQTVARMIVSAQGRIIEARREELAAIRDELRDRHLESARRLEEARDKYRRAQERAREKELRLRANQAFLAAGGTRGDFARLWPSVLQDVVRARSDGRAV
jgi:DNA-binding response OmpR family regulator